MTLNSSELDAALIIRNNLDNHTYEALFEERLLGLVVYELAVANRLVLTHAVVEKDHRQQGIGTRLMTWMLDDIRAQKLSVTVYCDVVVRFLHDHPEYGDLIDPRLPGHAELHS
jgi:predicted GNAT family acetyltransferase